MLLLIILIALRTSHALIGFDCGGQHLNITTVSLLGAGDCDVSIKRTNTTDTYIQLLQLSEYNYAEVIQCKVEITRTIYYCGMHSHISAVHNGHTSYLEHVVSDKCDRMHKDGVVTLGNNNVITGLKVNSTISQGITLAGTIGVDGKCSGISYTDPYGSWTDVVVQATARISLRSSYVPVHINSGKIYLKSGTICNLADGYCIDTDNGHTFWKPMPITSCDFHQYDTLYEGPAVKIKDDTTNPNTPTVYSLTTQDITFALTTTREQHMCGYILLRTEHPKLFILETTKENRAKPRGEIQVDNLDIFAYVNSKFVYVEKHIRGQMTSLYYNVMEQRCQLEKEVIKNTLSLATLLPDEFAFRIMKEPGYMAVPAGESIHIVKCIPVEVTVRRTKDCYQELPVTVSNTSLFLTPRSRILTKIGTQRECSHELPTLYQIEETWIQFTPDPHILKFPPQLLQPLTKISWAYMTPGPLAVSGIYTQQDIDKLRDHIMFPAEKPALLNTIARGITGYATGEATGSMYNLLNEDTLEKIAENTASRIWGGFLTFGSATAGIFGIFIIFRIIKMIIDTLLHGYALHSAYGCSVHLVGALWSSITHLLLHLAHGPPKRKYDRDNKDNDDNEWKFMEMKEPAVRRPTTPRDPVIEIENIEKIVPTPEGSRDYIELSKRIHALEQIPPITSGVCSKNRGEM